MAVLIEDVYVQSESVQSHREGMEELPGMKG